MKLRLELTTCAKRDLSRIRRYIARRNPKAAESVRLRIRESLRRLSEFPESGHSTDNPEIRILSVPRYPYLVFYGVQTDAVVIHHIRDTRRSTIDPDDAKSA